MGDGSKDSFVKDVSFALFQMCRKGESMWLNI